MRIQKEIENVERVKDKIATMPLTMEDAIEFHKQVVDRIEKERKEINKELDLDDDIEEKGFTGASKEPKKVSTPELKKMKLAESLFHSLNEDLQDDLINDVYNKLGDLAFEYYEEKNENPTKEEWQRALDWFMEKFFDESNYLDYELEDDEFDESLNECDKFKKGDCKNYALDEAKISRQNQRRKKDAYLQRKEAEREKAEKEARERERIGDAAWGEKDWIAEREKGDLDFSNYSDEEKAEIEKRLKAFDDNKTAQAQYQRRKEAEEAKRAEEERKKAEQEKEERTKKRIERIGKLANAPKDIGNAFKKGLGIG